MQMKLLLKIISLVLLPLIIGETLHFINSEENEDHEVVSTYPDHIAGPYTGGFGEESCHSCHFDYDLNQPGGELLINGIPDSFESGKEYSIQIAVKRQNVSRAGFQMTSRFEDSTQAGSFILPANLTTTPEIDNEITYVQHGVNEVEAEGDGKTWKLRWIAPNQTDKKIIFNIAANAANGDASEFGDWIYVEEIITEPDM